MDLSKLFKHKPLQNLKKGPTEAKESLIVEGRGAFISNEYVEPEAREISVSNISYIYEHSPLLKKYVKSLVDECLRYKFTAAPKKGLDDNATAKAHADEVNALILKCNNVETFSEVREKYLKDYFIYGVAGIEIEPSDKSGAKALYAIPGYTIRLRVDETGLNFKDLKKAYYLVDPNEPNKSIADFPFDSVIYLLYDKVSDRIYGVPPVTAIYNDLLTDINASKYLKQNVNSVKPGVICLPKAPSGVLKEIVSKIALMCKKESRSKILTVNVDGKFLDLSNLTPTDNIALQKWLTQKANIYNIPPFALGIDVGGGPSAREQKDDFRALAEGIVTYELDKLNAILVNTKLKYTDIEITCPDFATKLTYERTRIAVRLVNGGIITPNEARERYLGMPKSADPLGDKLNKPRTAGGDTASNAA